MDEKYNQKLKDIAREVDKIRENSLNTVDIEEIKSLSQINQGILQEDLHSSLKLNNYLQISLGVFNLTFAILNILIYYSPK
jgi:hypothetical protein